MIFFVSLLFEAFHLLLIPFLFTNFALSLILLSLPLLTFIPVPSVLTSTHFKASSFKIKLLTKPTKGRENTAFRLTI